jgi:glycosyltransferase involved in cell wall biosynthesis
MDTVNFKDLLPYYKIQKKVDYKYRFTVFTPVFNCEKTIRRVHESLLKQTYTNFEWLIINDASTDKSHEIILNIIEDSPLRIRYINNKENKHKMSCFIQSIGISEGEFLLPLDGDDECNPNALEVFNREYNNIEHPLKSKVAAITVGCKDQYGNKIGQDFPNSPFYCNTFEARIRKQIVGEKWGFTKTDVLRNIKVNPKMLEIGYVPESIIWDVVADNFITKCLNVNLRIYHVGREGSIMNTPITAKNALGTVLNGVAQINTFHKTYFFINPLYFFRILYVTMRTSKLLDYPLKMYIKSFDPVIIKLLTAVIWPFRKFLK